MEEQISLAQALEHVLVSPAEAAHMLQLWAQQHSGGAQPELSAKLNTAASELTNPPEVTTEVPAVETPLT